MLYNGIVEILGSAGKSSLVLVGKNRVSAIPKVLVQLSPGGKPQDLPAEPLVWKIQTRPPQQHLDELTRENFFQLLMEVTNG